MNSATLTKSDDAFQPWHFFVLVSILLATAAVFLTRRSTPEHLVLLSFTIAAAGITAAAVYRMLLPLASPAALLVDAPLTDRHRAALERDKQLTLRALKDLEFDRAMGKLSQRDFDEMGARLRQRAMTLMKQLDEGASYAPVIEKELQARLKSSPKGLDDIPVAEPVCACGTANDADAVFCKKCGARLRAS